MKEKKNLSWQSELLQICRIFSSALTSAAFKMTTHSASTTAFNYIG